MPEWLWPHDTRQIPSDDRGLAYAQGVFETIRVDPGGCVLLDAHFERLLAGCRALGIAFSEEDLQQWQQQAKEKGLLRSLSPSVLKLMVTAGSGGRGYRPPAMGEPRVMTTIAGLPEPPRGGARVRRCQHPLSVAGAAHGYKTLARLDQVLASAELGADEFEGLMGVTGEPGWVEGTRTCLFSLSRETLITPPREKLAVAGTLRDWVVSSVQRLGLKLETRCLTQSDIESDGLLLGNSVMGLVPVSDCEGITVPISEAAWQLIERVNRELGFA